MTPELVTFVVVVFYLLLLQSGYPMLAIIIELLHKALHFCILEHNMLNVTVNIRRYTSFQNALSRANLLLCYH